ncbi:MAG: serine-pyruvate aminotransferase/archaeal aspartate aminotransferase [Anaerolineales bacterium]|nr:serine-pyruvate aminotransferase/archaeal aspartate aminotransferase [Anaerolineales bacterium]
MSLAYPELNPSPRLLLGPGPSSVHPRVLRAMATPLLGYMDPEFLKMLDETREMLRDTFQTNNELTLPVSGTGMSGMEAVLGNLLEPGDKLLVSAAGFFGNRLEELALRHGVAVAKIERPWGEVFTPEEIEAALKKSGAKAVAVVHAETSTGALQPMEGLGEVVHRHGALLIMDSVTSLGGVPVKLDEWGVDATYSGTQKCLGCPPGLAPVSVSERARDAIRNRKRKPDNWYFDLELLWKYWGPERVYHHTVSGTLVYALREGLRLVAEEGLEARWARHRANAEFLWEGLAELDLVPFVPPAHRLPTLTTVRVPDGVDEAKVRTRLRDEYGIEIGAGLGPLKGKVWRIGLMGYASRHENVTLLLGALREILR